MKHFSKIVIATVMIISLLALSACGGGSNGGSGEVKDTFVFGLSQELTDLDPHQETDAATRSILFNIFEGLVKATPEGDVTPAV
ncbi:MAG: ABC transporter substrate-binding protein, partial [Firmicutes bacterium]|nr:ABC transporter substrate-binding protein [Bacillota bacterium]